MWNVRKQKLKLTNKTEAQDNTSGQTLPPETETKRGQRGSGKARVQSAGPQEPNSVNKTTTGQGHRRTAGEENRAEAPGRNQPNNPTTTQATCAANSHLGKPKHQVHSVSVVPPPLRLLFSKSLLFQRPNKVTIFVPKSDNLFSPIGITVGVLQQTTVIYKYIGIYIQLAQEYA
jgi:hypothetical protein